MVEKYWCYLTETRYPVTLNICRECDILAELPVGSYKYCQVRKPYQMPICEAFHDLIWWLKLLWQEPIDFLYFLVSELFRALGLRWGWSITYENGKKIRKLYIGLA